MKMCVEKRQLIQILRDTRALLALPDNDFSWSSWENAEAALQETDALIAKIEIGATFSQNTLSMLFTVAGPIQEVGLSSGWAKTFLLLAQRFDTALARFENLVT